MIRLTSVLSRVRVRRGHDPLDPELEALFLRSSRVPIPEQRELIRARTRIARTLTVEGARGASQPAGRFAFRPAGGAALWAGALGTALTRRAADARSRIRGPREESLDPQLEALVKRASRVPIPEQRELMRARSRIGNALAVEAPGAAGRFKRRLAFGATGGAGIWAAALGSAAAHQVAAAAIGLGVLAGGAVAVETTGLGSAVREAALEVAGIQAPAAVEETTAPGQSELAQNEPLVTNDVGPAEGSAASVEVEQAEGAPGNLLFSTVGPEESGRFVSRALIQWDDAEGTPVLVTADGRSILVDEHDTILRGPRGEVLFYEDLSGLTDALVLAVGICEREADEITTCKAESVRILSGGTGGPPPGDGNPVSEASGSSPGTSKPSVPPQAADQSASGRPSESGPPAERGDGGTGLDPEGQ